MEDLPEEVYELAATLSDRDEARLAAILDLAPDAEPTTAIVLAIFEVPVFMELFFRQYKTS